MPDVVGNARVTVRAFYTWHNALKGWPLAFVAQDGQEDLDLPEPTLWTTLFVGGTTDWKLSKCARRDRRGTGARQASAHWPGKLVAAVSALCADAGIGGLDL